MNKICGKCKIDKSLSEFVKNKNGKHGVSWACKDCRHKDGSKYYQDNKDRIVTYRQLTDEKNRQRQWRQANQHVKNYFSASYRAQQKLATPKWLTKQQIAEMKKLYKEAKRLSVVTKIEHHVDHIIPINGKNVSGLHVPWNLQILTRQDNIKKSNKVDNEAIAS